MTLKIGDRAPDVSFTAPDGAAVPLASFAGKPLLLVYLRHLG